MSNNTRTACYVVAAIRRIPGFAILLLLLINNVAAQTTTTSSSTDGATPPALAPGAPAGSYALSDFDSINPYNGNLNFHLPLIHIGGRGEAGYTVTLPIEQKWRVEHTVYDPNQYCETCEVYDIVHTYWPNSNWWTGLSPGYSPGVLQGRPSVSDKYGTHCTSNGHLFDETLTRFTFTAADGTEYELRDVLNGGKPLRVNPCNNEGPSRGTVFVTADGTSATFISDTEIRDYMIALEDYTIPGSGYLILRDGTRYRIRNGRVKWMRDRNGNQLTFTYSSEQYPEGPYGDLIKVTDSLGREVTFTPPSINYSGVGGVTQTISILSDSLAHRLRPANAEHPAELISTPKNLFPRLDGDRDNLFDPGVVSAVVLPDNRQYKFYYNSYGELARVELPTGGAFEYDWTGATGDEYHSGVMEVPGSFAIYRRVVERRVYSADGTLESRMTISPDFVVDQYDPKTGASPGMLLSRVKHFYLGSATPQIAFQWPTDLVSPFDGKEISTQVFGSNGTTLLQRVVNTWEAGTPLSASPNLGINPRIADTTTTLVDTNQVTKQTFSYDQYNNKTDVYEYDFGIGAPGALVRHSHTDYLTSGYDTNTDIHLRSLPTQQQVFDAGGNEKARTTYAYDEAAYPLIALGGMAGWSDPGTSARGNVTTVSRWLNTTNTYLQTHAQYDSAGNVRRGYDANGNVSTVDYSATYQYAYPTSTTSAIPDPSGVRGSSTAFTTGTAYDFNTGLVTSSTDANSQTTTFDYTDALNRLKKVTSPDGGEITYNYGDTTGNLYVETLTKQDATTTLDGYKYFDGLGRVWRTALKEDASTYTISDTQYDSLGRVWKISNPYRATTLTGAANFVTATTTLYDALGRALSATTPDGAVVTTSYSGNQVTVKDQANKQRQSTTDALGRLAKIVEAPNDPTYNYQTTYAYDALDNLTNVTQGQQTRTFAYDSLKRLSSATNPESGTASYQYDNNGNILTKTDARGITTTYAYDALNRATTRSYSDGTPTVTYTYDAVGVTNSKGRLTSLSSSVSTTGYGEYDALGRVKQSTQTTSGAPSPYVMSYGYDLAGHKTSETYPSGRVITTVYGGAGREQSVAGQISGANKTYASQFSYSAHGAVSAMQLGNGLWEHTAFNNRLQPEQIGLGTLSTNASILQLDYTYHAPNAADNNGDVQTQTITAPGITLAQSYSYDSLNRLQVAQESNGASWKQTFTYDQYGNRRLDAANTTPGTILENPVINPANNRITPQANEYYHYDAAGNLDRDISNNAFTYDAENKQTSFAGGVANSGPNYAYDGAGKRVKKVTPSGTTIYVYDAEGQMVAEYSTVAPQGTGGTSYLTADSLGTPRVITDQSGNVKARHDYKPFGEEIGLVGGRNLDQHYAAADNLDVKFTGKRRDAETGLDFFEARYYSSTQGRFTSPDEFSGGPDEFYDFHDLAAANPTFYADLTDPQSLNKYHYAYNNPLLYVDPDGHQGVREYAREMGEYVGGVARGVVSSVTYGAIGAPRSDDSLTSRAGQAVGTTAVAVVGTDAAWAGGGVTIGSGGTALATGVPEVAVAGGLLAAGGATKNAAALASTPMRRSGNSQEGRSREEQESSGESKPKKERSAEGARVQRENIEQAQKVHRKAGRPDRIRSIEKSKQNERNALKKIRSSKDLQEN